MKDCTNSGYAPGWREFDSQNVSDPIQISMQFLQSSINHAEETTVQYPTTIYTQ